jgi:ATP-dependent DNA helicase RecQ
LRALRRRIAAQKNVPPYVVFSDRTLRELCARLPATPEEMLGVYGVGAVKLSQYGQAFLKILAPYVDKKIERAAASPTLPGPVRSIEVDSGRRR